MPPPLPILGSARGTPLAGAGHASAGDPADRRIELLGLTRDELAARLGPWLDRPFRAAQVFDAIYHQGKLDFTEMTDLRKGLRAELAAHCRIGVPPIAERRRSADGTCKVLLALDDGATIEAVDIPDDGRRTLCLSSQAGCALACAFCVTGYWGAGRNLTAAEIVGQVLAIRRDHALARGEAAAGGATRQSLNLVFMGMGEPLLNLTNVAAALEVLLGLISYRRVTISTAGVIPGIEEIARWRRRPNLAVSLHAPDQDRRSRIIPLSRTYPLPDLLEALRCYPLERGRRLTIEYLLIRGFNDAAADADALARLLRGLRAKVNLIPVNPDPVLDAAMVPPSPEVVEAFQRRLWDRGLVATVRRRRGDEVSAACGQLRAPGREPRGFRQGAMSF